MGVRYIAEGCPRPFRRAYDAAYSALPLRRRIWVVIVPTALALRAYHPDYAAIPSQIRLSSPLLADNLRFLACGCGHPLA